jgi:hypothetical protein
MQKLREQPDTARAGIKWTEEESQELMNRIKDGMSLEDIAKTHQRTIIGVKNRIMANALHIMKENKMSFDEVSKLVNISVFDLENYKQYQDNKGEKPDKKESDNLSLQQITKLEIKKLELEIKKLELEIKKLELEVK